MAGAKIMVLYPTPRDPAAFEKAYRDEHTPMVTPSANGARVPCHKP